MDNVRGEANFDIDDEGIDSRQPSLFPEHDKPRKLDVFERELEDAILGKEVYDNKQIYIYALERGFLARHAKKVVSEMIHKGRLPKQNVNISYDAWKSSKPKQVIVLPKGNTDERNL
ncbi:MAG: hypothetical protein EOL88_04790 [Bacteroidia bacterium]|nr:hypothetical protein [Bacteroidia bacterium]